MEIKKMDLLKQWVERQRDFLNDITRKGFTNVIDSDELYVEWLEYEFNLLCEMILDDDIEDIISLVEGD